MTTSTIPPAGRKKIPRSTSEAVWSLIAYCDRFRRVFNAVVAGLRWQRRTREQAREPLFLTRGHPRIDLRQIRDGRACERHAVQVTIRPEFRGHRGDGHAPRKLALPDLCPPTLV